MDRAASRMEEVVDLFAMDLGVLLISLNQMIYNSY